MEIIACTIMVTATPKFNKRIDVIIAFNFLSSSSVEVVTKAVGFGGGVGLGERVDASSFDAIRGAGGAGAGVDTGIAAGAGAGVSESHDGPASSSPIVQFVFVLLQI